MRHKRASLFTKVVVLVLVAYTTVTLIKLRTSINEAEVNMVEIENQIQEKSASISALQYEIEHRNDPETIESIAREKLGLKLPGERVFYVGN